VLILRRPGRTIFTHRTQQMIDYAELKSEYARLWASLEISPDKRELVMRIARKLMRHKTQYLAVEAATGVPWFVIAALHNRESDADFATYLGNGEPLGRKTTLVPKGRGPFESWEVGAADALALDGLDRVNSWSPERACFEIEKFNGFGYRKRGVHSPYLWSFSNHYARGKYVADGRFSATAVDEQCGAIPILKAIMELDGSARFKTNTLPATKPVTITTILGGILGILAHVFGVSPDTIAIIFIGAFILAAIVYAFIRIRP
jgi:lysozyme family protein